MIGSNRILLTAIASMALASAATSQVFVFATNLDGPSEFPPNASPGTGESIVTMDTGAITMRVQIDFRDLVGTTTACHIHAPTATANTGTAGVATQLPSFVGFPLGATSGTYDNTFDMTQASSYNPAFITNNGGTPVAAFNALFGFMVEQRSYVNVHSSVFPGGEIRGFLHLVPEPATLAVLGLGSLALLRRVQRRNRRH